MFRVQSSFHIPPVYLDRESTGFFNPKKQEVDDSLDPFIINGIPFVFFINTMFEKSMKIQGFCFNNIPEIVLNFPFLLEEENLEKLSAICVHMLFEDYELITAKKLEQYDSEYNQYNKYQTTHLCQYDLNNIKCPTMIDNELIFYVGAGRFEPRKTGVRFIKDQNGQVIDIKKLDLTLIGYTKSTSRHL